MRLRRLAPVAVLACASAAPPAVAAFGTPSEMALAVPQTAPPTAITDAGAAVQLVNDDGLRARWRFANRTLSTPITVSAAYGTFAAPGRTDVAAFGNGNALAVWIEDDA